MMTATSASYGAAGTNRPTRSIDRGLARGLFLLAAFPYVTPFDTPFDIQPWALAIGVFVAPLGLRRIPTRIPWQLKALFALAMVAIVRAIPALVGYGEPLAAVRSLAGYVTLCVFATLFWRSGGHVHQRLLLGVVLIWLLAWVAQLLLGAEALAVFLPRVATTATRGLTSLAPEPADYARTMLLIAVFAVYARWRGLVTPRGFRMVSGLALIQVLLTVSGVGVVFLVTYGVLLVGTSLILRGNSLGKLARVGGVAVGLVVVLYGFSRVPMLGESRAGRLLAVAIENPALVLASDLSVTTRLYNPIFAAYGGLIETRGIGFGLGAPEPPGTRVPAWLGNAMGSDRGWGGTVMGGLAAATYELGFFGILLIVAVAGAVLPRVRRWRSQRGASELSAGLLFLGLTVPWGTFAAPLVGATVGLALRDPQQ